MATSQDYRQYRFSDFVLENRSGRLSRNNYEVKLQEQPTRLLLLLVENAGAVVDRAQIQQALWPDNTYVEFDQSLRVAVSKLREALRDDASQPVFIETIPRRGYRFIAPVSEVQPETTVALTVGPLESQTPPSRLWLNRPRLMAIALPLLGLLAVVGASLHWLRDRAPHTADTAAAQPLQRRSVAILGLRNLSGSAKDDWLATGVAEMLRTELATADTLRVVSGEEVARAGIGSALQGSPSHEALAEAAHRMGVDMVVYGSYSVSSVEPGVPASMRLDLELENIGSDAPSLALARTGKTSDIFSLVASAGSELRQRLGLESLNEQGAKTVRATLPGNAQAAQYYAEGVFHLRNYDPMTARALLEQAARLEPTHAFTLLALSQAWSALGYEQQARQSASRAVTLGRELTRTDLLELQGNEAITSHDWQKAVDIYRSLATFYPDEVRYTIRLTDALNNAGRAKEGLSLLEPFKARKLSDYDRVRLDLSEARLQHKAGNFAVALAAVDRVVDGAQKLGLQLLRAQALEQRALECERLSRASDALQASAQAQQLFDAVGDRTNAALARLFAGDVSYDTGRLDQAKAQFEAALAVFRQTGNLSNTAVAVERVGNVSYMQGQLRDAEAKYREALGLYRTLDQTEGVGSALGNLANVQDTAGDLVGALATNRESLELFRKTGIQRGEGVTHANMGNVEMELGLLDDAEHDYRAAIQIAGKINYPRGQAYASIGYGDLLVSRNRVAEGLALYRKMIAEHVGKEEADVRAQAEASLGYTELHTGHAADAERDLSSAASDANLASDDPLAVDCLVWLSLAQDAQGKLQQANETALKSQQQARRQIGTVSNLMAEFVVDYAALRAGKRSSQAALDSVVASAQQHRYGPMTVDMRIASASAQPSSPARNHALRQIASDASAHGWSLLAASALDAASQKHR